MKKLEPRRNLPQLFRITKRLFVRTLRQLSRVCGDE
jgi:hypothetical protein